MSYAIHFDEKTYSNFELENHYFIFSKLSMKSNFNPDLIKMYVFKKHTFLFLNSGEGTFQVDFKNYHYTANKAIFLSPGQYFQLLSGSFSITLYEFSDDSITQIHNSRFLFKHLMSIGHIDFTQPEQFYLQKLQSVEMSTENALILTKAVDDWTAFNPFEASKHDVNLLFDLKDFIDEKYREPINLNEVAKKLKEKSYRLNLVTKQKLDYTVRQLATDKILLESQRKVIFTNLSTKEIAYDTGFQDPSYFNRFFKQQTSYTPLEFREKYEFDERDTFVQDLNRLIDAYFKVEHSAEFYANQLNVTVKALSKKIFQKLDTSIKFLLSKKIIVEAQIMLQQQMAIREIAFELGFQEPNHFSTFFKIHSGKTASQFLANL
jgi:AraC-like DNA-binding protein